MTSHSSYMHRSHLHLVMYNYKHSTILW